jgi:enoyl-[acyl-carrier protein] reductase I
MTQTLLMNGKKGLVMGIANEHSIAWGITKILHEQGAQMAFSYQGDILLKRIEPLLQSLDLKKPLLIPCNVADDSSIDALAQQLRADFGKIDFIVHAVAFSDKNELKGRYVDTSRANFNMTMDISCYSFTAICQKLLPLLNTGASCLTLSYYGAEKVMPHYNVMGVAKAALEASVQYLAVDLGKDNIRINGLSAGPMRTLAAAGISDFRYMLKWTEANAPLRRNITQEDVGNSALYLLSHLSSGVTGEILHVDSGYHVVGMKAIDAEDINLGS